MTWTAVDLFCGAGGLSAGLEQAGFRIVGAIDSWDAAIQSYRLNFHGHSAHLADIGSLDADQLSEMGLPQGVDLLAGGPPCQGFSIQRIGSDTDDRNDLICSFARMVDLIRPKIFIMENVPGLLGRRGRSHFERFVAQVSRSGYRTAHAVLDAADFKVAQFRKRVFVVGWPSEAPVEFQFPTRSVAQPLTVREVIGSLPEPPLDHSPSLGDPLHRRTRMSALNIERLQHIPPGGGFEDLPIELRVNCHKQGAAKIGHRNVYGRLSLDEPASTITARFDSFTRGRFAHPIEHRNITLREGARLQGFSDAHRFVGTQEDMAALIGNSVPPPLAYSIASAALSYLEKLTDTVGAHQADNTQTTRCCARLRPRSGDYGMTQPSSDKLEWEIVSYFTAFCRGLETGPLNGCWREEHSEPAIEGFRQAVRAALLAHKEEAERERDDSAFSSAIAVSSIEQISALQSRLDRVTEALFRPLESDITLNLEGVVEDLSGMFDPKDGGVCVRTIKRVIEQIEQVREALSSTDEGVGG